MRKLLSLIAGLLLTILGGIPLLNAFGLLSFTIPVLGEVILLGIAGAAGIVLLIDGIVELRDMHPSLGMLSILLAFILIALGTITILIHTGSLAISLPLIPLLVNILLTLGGVFLIIGSMIGW